MIDTEFWLVGSIPSLTETVVADRLKEDLIRIRILTDSLLAASYGDIVYDEYVIRNPKGYVGIASGWMLTERRNFVFGEQVNWLVSPRSQGSITNTDFAIRIGYLSDPYVSGGDTGDWRYRSFGHSGVNLTDSDVTITKDSQSANLHSTEEFPVGTSIRGNSLTINMSMKLYARGNPTDIVASLSYKMSFDKTVGLRRTGKLAPLVEGIGFQDSYTLQMAASAGYADRAKISGVAPEILSNPKPGVQRPTTYPSPWGQSSALTFQLYKEANRSLVETCSFELGQPLFKTGGGLAPWGLNISSRGHVSDETNFAKIRVAGASSTAAPESRAAIPLNLGDEYVWQHVLQTKFLPGGPI